LSANSSTGGAHKTVEVQGGEFTGEAHEREEARCSTFASPESHDEEWVSCMAVSLETYFVATVVFGDSILEFEGSVGDSLRLSSVV
jgi:hypothetical protein